METLDAQGKMLYDNYIKARNEWTAHIAPIAQQFIQDTLKNANKIYYRFDYVFANYNINMAGELTSCDNSNKSPHVKKIYKKLSLLFHPDKFKVNDNLFKFIKTKYDNNDTTILSKMNNDIDILLDFSCEEIDDYIKRQSSTTNKPIITDETQDYDYTTTMQYKMFISNNINMKDYYSASELINHIENDFISDKELQYYNIYKDSDDNIRIGLEKRVAKKNEELNVARQQLTKTQKELNTLRQELDEAKKRNCDTC